jgi:hypothetical protein
MSTGKLHSEATKAKIRLAQLGSKNHMFGQHHSQETKDKISKALFGKPLGAETKAKMSAAQRGNKKRLGKTHSDATKELMSKMRAGNPWSQRRRVLHQQKKQKEKAAQTD